MQMKKSKFVGIIMMLLYLFLSGACTSQTVMIPTESSTAELLPPTKTSVPPAPNLPEATSTETLDTLIFADVLSVGVSGNENAYTFAVEIRSPDTGCQQYADWWEVVAEDGGLIYRRILTHSHVNEQPFTRSGSSVGIIADTIVIVRAHMYPTGYGGAAFRGSVTEGFEAIQPDPDFAPGLEIVDPLPDGCAF
jgi:hypothetical protein